MGTIPAVLRAAAEQFAEMRRSSTGARLPTFTDITELVEEVERALIASGVSPGDRVGMWAPNGLDWIDLFRDLWGRGVLVPINTRFKADEAGDVLRTAEVGLLFTVTDFLTPITWDA